MNKRKYKKKYKDCSTCRYFDGWDNFTGQYGEYDMVEIPPYFCPYCDIWDKVEEYYIDMPLGCDFREYIYEKRNKYVCKFWRKKWKRRK